MSDAKDRLTKMKDVFVIASSMRDAYRNSGNLAPLFDKLSKALGDATEIVFGDNPIEPEQTIVDGGFAAAYTNHDGTIGFLDTDDGPQGSGYPTFSKKPDHKHIYTEITKADRDVKNIDGMKNHFGHDKIDFDTVRVVQYGIIATELVDRDEMIYQQTLENARSKLSDEELQALIRSAQPTG